ncbi:DUF4913 domain-containing protein [Gordonia rubripertincta]|uniref:DUF4913 domain-containing protein n=1 Tax=Gordonia rubripertincta TaxID=36822 RepID=UPI000B8DA481|nr:DUF4913 domain-containing protein [Gordonia rubripertincta]ASR05616.1 hypothetical protein GCWB2_24225 [Gordonia rubripertincta]
MTDPELAAQIEVLRQQLAAVRDSVLRHSDALTALEDGMAAVADDSAIQAAHDAEDAESTGGAQLSLTPDLDVLRQWVTANVSEWCERRVATTASARGIHWCGRWDLHPESVARLWAVRAAQIAAAEAGPAAVSDYLRDHFDHHLGVLTGEHGPFFKCTPDKHAAAKSEAASRFLVSAVPLLHLAG